MDGELRRVHAHRDPTGAGRQVVARERPLASLIQPALRRERERMGGNDEAAPQGRPLVAVDSVGCGVSEEVFYVRGREASFPFLPAEVPADAAIVGIVDHWNVG